MKQRLDRFFQLEAHPRAMIDRSPERMFPIALITFFAFVVRLWDLSAQSLWFDEAYTSMVIGFDWFDIAFIPLDVHPPLYYLLTKLISICGQTEFSLRLLSVLAGTATVPIVWMIGERIGSSATGLLASLLLAFHPIHIDYSQEARSYALLFLLLSLCLHGAIRVFQEDLSLETVPQHRTRPLDRHALLLYGAGAILALHTHLISAIYLAVLNGTLICGAVALGTKWNDSRVLSWIATNVIVATVFLPWFLLMRETGSAFGWLEHIRPIDFLFEMFQSLGYETAPFRANLLLAPVFPIAAVILYVRGRTISALVLVTIAAIPSLIWAVGFFRPIFMTRTILPALLAWVILQAVFVTSFRHRAAAFSFGALLVCLNLYGTAEYFSGRSDFARPHAPLRALSVALSERDAEDGIYLSCQKVPIMLAPYLSDDTPVYLRLTEQNQSAIIPTTIANFLNYYKLPVSEQRELPLAEKIERFGVKPGKETSTLPKLLLHKNIWFVETDCNEGPPLFEELEAQGSISVEEVSDFSELRVVRARPRK